MTEMYLQIATATEQQSAVAAELNGSLAGIDRMSDEVAGSARHTSSASQDLERLADRLHQLVRKFSLGQA